MSHSLVTVNSNPARCIAEHSLIGDLHTTASVNLDGSIVWLCWPHHDSSPVFGALLDPAQGDASSLLIGKTGFIPSDHACMKATIQAIKQPFGQGGLMEHNMIYKYDWRKINDLGPGYPPKRENPFNLCTFWLVEAMARTGDPAHTHKAQVIFEHMLRRANRIGLYAEQTGANDEAGGDYPQAFSHLGLINAAVALDRAQSGHDSCLAQNRRNRQVTA